MSWQDKERERYEKELAERWTVNGERKPKLLGGAKKMYDLYMTQLRQAQSPTSHDAGYYRDWATWEAFKDQD